MVQEGNLKFSTSLGVLYELKNKHGHTKLNETYKMLSESQDVDSIIEILNISYNKANKVNLIEDEFTALLDENGLGFVKISQIFSDVFEGIMFNGLTPEEVAARKNQIANLMK